MCFLFWVIRSCEEWCWFGGTSDFWSRQLFYLQDRLCPVTLWTQKNWLAVFSWRNLWKETKICEKHLVQTSSADLQNAGRCIQRFLGLKIICQPCLGRSVPHEEDSRKRKICIKMRTPFQGWILRGNQMRILLSRVCQSLSPTNVKRSLMTESKDNLFWCGHKKILVPWNGRMKKYIHRLKHHQVHVGQVYSKLLSLQCKSLKSLDNLSFETRIRDSFVSLKEKAVDAGCFPFFRFTRCVIAHHLGWTRTSMWHFDPCEVDPQKYRRDFHTRQILFLKFVSRRHVTAGNLQDALSFSHAFLVVGRVQIMFFHKFYLFDSFSCWYGFAFSDSLVQLNLQEKCKILSTVSHSIPQVYQVSPQDPQGIRTFVVDRPSAHNFRKKLSKHSHSPPLKGKHPCDTKLKHCSCSKLLSDKQPWNQFCKRVFWISFVPLCSIFHAMPIKADSSLSRRVLAISDSSGFVKQVTLIFSHQQCFQQ